MEIEDGTAASKVAGLIPKTKGASESETATAFEREMEVILEKGFQKYVEDISKKKREELREKILKAMGLDEDKLANLPPEQRQHIERMVADEIQKQIAAESSQKNGEGAKWNHASEPGNISQQVLATRTGMGGAALAMQAIFDNRDLQTSEPKEE